MDDDLYEDDFWDDGPYHADAFFVDSDDDLWGRLLGDAAFRDPQVRAENGYHAGPTWSTVQTILTRLVGFICLSPLDAAQAWLGFEFGSGEMYGLDEELALCVAVRRDPDITLSPDAVFEIFDDALLSGDFDHDDEALLAEQATAMLDRLRGLSARSRR